MPTRRQLIQKITLNANASSVTFSNIPQNYTDLKLVCSLRGSINAVWGTFSVQFNEVDTATYSNRRFVGSGTAASSGGDSNVLAIFGIANGSTSTANTFTNCEFYIPNYTSNSSKSVQSVCALENNGTEAYITKWAQLAGGVTLPITSIKLFDRYGGWGNMIANSTFYLYGITHVPIIRGGEEYVLNGFKYHKFTSTAALQVIEGGDVEALVVAGGGGGRGNGGGGGGAGGLSYNNSKKLDASTIYTVTVGAGGTADGNAGSNSVLDTITSNGGGPGNINLTASSADGGSGGGGGRITTSPGTSTQGSLYAIGYGNNGGSGTSSGTPNYGTGGGGGGAGAVGGNGSGGGFSSGTGGNGGIGKNDWSSWAVGVGGYLAGGGGGGSNGTPGVGGLGGGGNGAKNIAFPGIENSGGGGGGGGNATNPVGGGNGGSGIVIIRYPYDGN